MYEQGELERIELTTRGSVIFPPSLQYILCVTKRDRGYPVLGTTGHRYSSAPSALLPVVVHVSPTEKFAGSIGRRLMGVE